MSGPYGIYERLGVRPVINGVGTVTRLGGSLMPPPVLEAMLEAARQYVPLDELQAAAGRRLAELTRNEAAYVSSGAACRARAGDGRLHHRGGSGEDGPPALPPAHPRRALQGGHPALPAHRLRLRRAPGGDRAGGGRPATAPRPAARAAAGRPPEELAGALDERTAAVLYIAGAAPRPRRPAPRARWCAIAHGRGVPVIVDGAAQIPPVENLWAFTGGRPGALGAAPWPPSASPATARTTPRRRGGRRRGRPGHLLRGQGALRAPVQRAGPGPGRPDPGHRPAGQPQRLHRAPDEGGQGRDLRPRRRRRVVPRPGLRRPGGALRAPGAARSGRRRRPPRRRRPAGLAERGRPADAPGADRPRRRRPP